MRPNQTARREGIKVHLEPGQCGGRGYIVGKPIPERDDYVGQEVVPYGSCPTVLVATPSAETFSCEIFSSSWKFHIFNQVLCH